MSERHAKLERLLAQRANCPLRQLGYVSRYGHAFIDRALYLPKGWTDDPVRLTAAYVPDDVGFSTKPALAAEMIERALVAGVPFRWLDSD
jgi:SRSO17 transposase